MKKQGLYDPAYEHDACGVAFVARLDGRRSHETVDRALQALANLEHRGAEGADAETGDGAGILVQVPDAFLRSVVPFELPPPGRYGVAVCFLPHQAERRRLLEQMLEEAVVAEGQQLLGWRDIPTRPEEAGSHAQLFAPAMRQLYVGASADLADDQMAFERKLYVIRRLAEQAGGDELVIPSFSSRTLVYKGMLTAPQLRRYFPDLSDERFASALALVHSRYSTNTFPSWELAHPYRLIAHNGEINTLRGNVNWIRARESQLASELFGDDLAKVLPVIRAHGSDTAMLDNVLELLVLAGRSLPHALMMMVPEAYDGRPDVSDDVRGFYRFHECLTEAWDGPAAIAFTDGTLIGATLDRNGLRPGRWLETTDGWVVMASETGVLDIPASQIRRKGRLQPGRLFLVDLDRGRIVPDEEIKQEVATRQPYGEWYEREHVRLADLPRHAPRSLGEPLRRLQLAFGYTQEDMKVMLAPLAANAEEAIGSMGNDTPLAVLSQRRPLIYSYFKQLFAQVTNPPIDPIREAVVMSVRSLVGSERNLLDETPEHARQLVIDNPILRDEELESLRQVRSDVFKAHTIDTTWAVEDGPEGLEPALARICAEADEALADGANILVLSDRAVGPTRVAIPSLLAVGAIHHHLVRAGTRLQAGLVVESGEPRSVQSVAVLIGYGAAAVNPYLMLATIRELVDEGRLDFEPRGSRGSGAEGDRQGPAEDDLQDGHLGPVVVLRRPGVRGRRARARADRPPLHRHRVADRRHRRARARRGLAHAPRARLSRHRRRAAARGRALRVAARRRAPPVEPRDDRAAAARSARGRAPDVRAVRGARERRLGPPLDAPRATPLRRARARAARGGRAGGRDRQALLDRGDVARLALARGARDARRGDEPPWWALEHR